ncbi:MAG: hypothetical protein AAF492_18195, partial [Verrucomicrobiota bacterium]
GFFGLKDDYAGIPNENRLGTWLLSITVNNRTKQVSVENMLEPAAFRQVREQIEEFAKNELGIIAISLPPEKLKELAYDAYLNAQKLFEAREVRYVNLYKSIQAYNTAKLHLNTINPKPDYYPDVIQTLDEAKQMLQDRYDSHIFQADQARVLKEWETAANELKIIREMIPDRGDERYKTAEIKLLEVERQLRK